MTPGFARTSPRGDPPSSAPPPPSSSPPPSGPAPGCPARQTNTLCVLVALLTFLAACAAALQPRITAPLSYAPPPPPPDEPFRNSPPEATPLDTAPTLSLAKTRLSNGLPVVLVPRPGLPVLSVRLLVDRGPRDLPERRPELLDLAMDVLVREHQAGADVATDVAPRASCGTDGCTLGVDCLARSLDAALRVLADLALRPKYPAWQQGRLRQDHDTWMLHLRSSTDGALTTNARALLFAPGDVSAPPWPGAPSPIGPTTMADLRETHAQLFQPAHATLVVAGDTTLEALAPAAERAFGAWTATRPVVPRVTAQTPLPAPGPRLVLVPQPSDLAHAYLAARAPADNEAALDAVWLVAVLLSMPDGDLSEQVRSHLGAVYTLRLQRREGRAGSWFLLGGAFEPSRLVPAITAIVAAVRAVRDQGVRPAALEIARTRMVAMLRESTGTVDGATSAVVAALSAGLAPETVLTRHARIARLTPEIVQKVAQVWLAEDLLRVVVIGNANQIAHPFTELALGAPDWRNAGRRAHHPLMWRPPKGEGHLSAAPLSPPGGAER